MGLASYKPMIKDYCYEKFNIVIPTETIENVDTALEILKSAKYSITAINFLVSIAILVITRYCNIPGRIFRLFIYNTYGLNLISLVYFVCSEIFGEDFDGNLEFLTNFMALGSASAYTALSTVLPYTAIRFYFLVGFKIFEENFSNTRLLAYTILYDLAIGSIFYATYIFHGGRSNSNSLAVPGTLALNMSEESNILISIYIMSTLQGFIVVASITFIICTHIYLHNATVEQKFIISTRESSPDRQKILRICLFQIILYGVQGTMEVVRFIETLNQWHWLCNPVFIYTLHYSRRLVQQMCMIIFALVILTCLNAYKRTYRELWKKIFRNNVKEMSVNFRVTINESL